MALCDMKNYTMSYYFPLMEMILF